MKRSKLQNNIIAAIQRLEERNPRRAGFSLQDIMVALQVVGDFSTIDLLTAYLEETLIPMVEAGIIEEQLVYDTHYSALGEPKAVYCTKAYATAQNKPINLDKPTAKQIFTFLNLQEDVVFAKGNLYSAVQLCGHANHATIEAREKLAAACAALEKWENENDNLDLEDYVLKGAEY